MLRGIPFKPLRMRDLLSITRPPNGVLMIVAVMVGYYVQSARLPNLTESFLASVTAYSLTSSSMILNDIVDRHIDAVSNPDRPIPSGRISVREAWVMAAFLGVVGLASAALQGAYTMIIAIGFYTLATLYNVYLKRRGLVGNMAVSASIAAPYIYGAVLAEGSVGLTVSVFALMSFLAGLGREIVKGIPDVEGDATKGIRTIAVTKGVKAAARVGALPILTAVVISPFPYLLGMVGLLYLPLVLVADAGFVYSTARLLSNPSTGLRVKKEYLLWMGIALIAFLSGSAV